MARDAVTLGLHRVCRRDFFVTALAGLIAGYAHRVGVVTAAAVAMLSNGVLGKRGLSSMAALALRGARGRKRMGLMAVDAGAVAIGNASKHRRQRDKRWCVLVALHARRSLSGEFVPPVAIRAGAA